MGTVYMRLGLYDEARKLLARGLATRQSLFGNEHPEIARSQSNLGELLGLQAELDEAADLYQQAIAMQRKGSDLPGPELASSLVGLADIRTLQGEFESAEELLREAVGILRLTLGEENRTRSRFGVMRAVFLGSLTSTLKWKLTPTVGILLDLT